MPASPSPQSGAALTEGALPQALPAEVKSWLVRVAESLVQTFGSDLESVILFGSAAAGQLRASSDVNLLVVLQTFDPDRAQRAGNLLEDAAAAIELHPMFVLKAELQLAAESFAVKFDDILHRRVLLFGSDPFDAISIPRALLVHRIRQVLLNLTLRLRYTYVLRGGREERLALSIADAAAPLRRSAQAILELSGRPDSSPKAALERLAAELGEDWSADLARMSAAREDLRLPAGVAAPLLLRLAALAEALQRRAGELAE